MRLIPIDLIPVLSTSAHSSDIVLEPADNERLANLCGQFDEHLRQIERRLGVEVNNRGNAFRVIGDSRSVQAAEEVLRDLYAETASQVLNPSQFLGDGSVYACDHYVYPEYRSGTILEKPLVDMAFSQKQEIFGKLKEGRLPEQCRKCKYQFTCFGESPKNRFIKTPDGEPGLNYLCSGWKQFFTHIDEPVQKIVRTLGEPVVKEARTRAAEHWKPEKQI